MRVKSVVSVGVFLLSLVTVFAVQSSSAGEADLRLEVTSQRLSQNEWGGHYWQTRVTTQQLESPRTALLLCDVWDKHWSSGATRRVNQMVARMNAVVQAARTQGIFIIHAPSDTMDFYRGTPARNRMLAAPDVPLPEPADHVDPPHPIDASDGGSDTGEKPWHKAWTRQHPVIEIDQKIDGISDRGQEVWNVLQLKGIKNVIILGVHTNMCVLNRSFGIKALVTRGINVVLVRDLTDPMYNPARSPYVDHDEGRRLMIGYVEKFWCPTIDSRQITGFVEQR
jgi:nicotinamidase-related amidase